jgi:hypothetical protein
MDTEEYVSQKAYEDELRHRLRVEQTASKLRAQLAKYGGHTSGCLNGMKLGFRCDCGWAEIEKGL